MVQTGFRHWRKNIGEILVNFINHWISDKLLGTSIKMYTGSDDNGKKGYQTGSPEIGQKRLLPKIKRKIMG